MGSGLRHIAVALSLAAALLAGPALAQPDAAERMDDRYQLRFQATNIWQGYPSFRAATSGDGSFPAKGQIRETVTATAYMGMRLLPGTEFWINPELAQGFGLNHSFGIAAFPNGDASKAGSTWTREYVARIFLRQTINLDGDREWVDAETNQLAGQYSPRRLVFTAGKLAVGDIFGDNRFSHDPRTQFMNWSLMEAGAWDFASDARQYSWGIASELVLPGRALRYGAFTMPTRYNPPATTWHGFGSLHHVLEFEQEYALAERPGVIRLLGFYTRAHMARFRDVLASPLPADEAMPALRRFGAPKLGLVVNIEQAITPSLGAFIRASWNDGRTEDLSYTQIDRSITGGLSLAGAGWNRPADTVGLAAALNGISRQHRAVLAAGAIGLIVGEGMLRRYGPERVAELYYNAALPVRGLAVALNYQLIGNPGYNRDRGPVHVFGLRLRFAFGM
jgi:high affinity Mn2+ porin